MTHGSLQNMMMANNVSNIEPYVGCPLTECHWTDRSAGTVVEVSKSGKTFWFTYDETKRIDNNGMSECQEYSYTPQPDGPRQKVTRRRDGRWKTSPGGSYVNLGYKRAYHDYSF